MRVFKRGDTYYGQFYENGVRIQRSTRCHDKKAAEAVVREWERAAADPAHAAAQAVTLGQVLQLVIDVRFEEALAGRKSHSTVSFYLRTAGHLIRVFGADCRLARIDAAGADRYISERRRELASDHTISKELVTLRIALKLARRRKLWKGDPGEVLPIGFAPAYKPKRRFLEPDELRKLLGELTPDKSARVAFTVAVAATWSDTDRALWADVTSNLTWVHVRGEKTSYRDRSVPIVAPWQLSLLKHTLLYAMGREEHLFTRWANVRRDVAEACERAKIPPCSPNDLRRTTATWLRRDGVSPDLIASVLGHADSRMVERVYGRLPPEILRARLSKELGGDCSAGATDRADSAGLIALPGRVEVNPSQVLPEVSVPRGGIEPPTRGFSVPVLLVPRPRTSRTKRPT
ncbi:MAG: tyrosine-type recombinase/integrase, partial [Deltaproteobacteria bacterium]